MAACTDMPTASIFRAHVFFFLASLEQLPLLRPAEMYEFAWHYRHACAAVRDARASPNLPIHVHPRSSFF